MANPSYQDITSYLQDKGFSRMDAAAIAGNIMQESNMNPFARGDRGKSFGLFQHHKSRKTALERYAQSRGKKSSNWRTQLDFMAREMRTTHSAARRAMAQATTLEGKTRAFTDHFERPHARHANHTQRASFAQQAFTAANRVSGGRVPVADAGLLDRAHVQHGRFEAPVTSANLGNYPSGLLHQPTPPVPDLPKAQTVNASMHNIQPGMRQAFQSIQNRMGQPLTVKSGYRSPMLNRQVRGAKHSQHMRGNALDISTRGMSRERQKEMIAAASRAGVTGYGIGPTIHHYDKGRSRSWGYSRASGGAPVPAWAQPTVQAAMRGNFMPTPTPRPEYTPPVSRPPVSPQIAAATPIAPPAPPIPARTLADVHPPLSPTMARPTVPVAPIAPPATPMPNMAGRVARAHEVARAPVTDPAVLAGVPPAPPARALSSTNVLNEVHPPLPAVPAVAPVPPVQPVAPIAPQIASAPVTAPRGPITPQSVMRDAKRAPGAIVNGFRAAGRGFQEARQGLPQGPPQYAGIGLGPVNAVRSGSMGFAQARTNSGHVVGFNPATGLTSVHNRHGATTYSAPDGTQFAGPGTPDPFGGLFDGFFDGKSGRGSGGKGKK